MTDTKISALTSLTDPALADVVPLVDVSDTSQAASGSTKKMTIPRVLQPYGIWSPLVNGIDTTGSSDCRAGIQTSIDDCFAAGGGIVQLPPGDLNIASSPGLVIKEGVWIRGAGMEATTLKVGVNLSIGANPNENAIIAATYGNDVPADLTDNVVGTLSANANVYATTLTLSSTASLTAGEWYMLGSDDRTFSTITARRGEYVRIQSIDSGTQVTLWGCVRDNYTTANGAKLYSITHVSGIQISDLRIDNPTFDATTTPMISLTACQGFAVERVMMTNGDTYGVRLNGFCRDGHVDVKARNFNDNNGANRNGYVVSMDGLCENIQVNIDVRRTRHGITCGPLANRAGLSRKIRVSGNVVESTAAAFDQHHAGQDWTFENCHAENCQGYGFQLRSFGTKMIGCTTNFCDVGLQLIGLGTLGVAEGVTAIGCEFRHSLNRTGSNGFAVQIEGSGSSTRHRFLSCVFEGSARQLFMCLDGEVRILDCDFINPGQAAGTRCLDVQSGSNAYVDGCNFWATTSATDEAASSTNTPGVEAIRLQSGTSGCTVTNTNRQVGFTGLCQDLGSGNTVERLTSAFTVSNGTTDRALNVTGDTLAQGLQVLGTLITDLQTRGVIP